MDLPQLSGVRIGDVVRVELAGEQDSYFLVLRDGIQRVTPAVANLLLFLPDPDDARDALRTFSVADISGAPSAADPLDFAHLPARVPNVLSVPDAPVVCLTWESADQQRPAMWVGADAGELAGRGVEVAGATGDQVGRVLLEPGTQGALVRGVVPGQAEHPGQTWAGQVWLVAEGLRYRVPGPGVARGLGYDGVDPLPAPDSILRLLKNGPALEPQRALSLLDADLADRPDGP